MFDENTDILRRAELIAQFGVVNDVLQELRKLCLWDFSFLLLSLPSDDWPHLSHLLPRMASDEVQISWTGASGTQLLATTTDFVRILAHHFIETNRRSLKDISVLDYGCGYGRIMRPLYYFTNPDNIHGVDPWDRSIEICRDDGLLGHITLSDYLPEQLPVSRTNFDLIYAYSVFTHTSRKATIAALTALRQVIAPSGLLVLTTRPIEWWSERPIQEQRAWNAHDQITAHRRDGFAFFPSTWNMPADGESIFGDTSMTADWINHACRSWHVIAYDRGIDPMQTIFVLAPK